MWQGAEAVVTASSQRRHQTFNSCGQDGRMEIDQLSPAADEGINSRATPQSRSVRTARLEVLWARHTEEVRDAQRLRHQVFVDEMGARLSTPAGTPAGLDVDRFDAACEHLLVRTVETADAPALVVGTYRVLTPAAAQLTGGLYSEGEFDLRSLAALRPRMAELGRSCTAPGWRQGGVILLLWTSLSDFMARNRLNLMVGCASVPMRDGGHVAASLWNSLQQTHLAAPERRVQPHLPLPVDQLNGGLKVETPALIKGYLRCGAKVLGAPAWDPDFGVADLPLMLDFQDLPASYRTRFIGG
jgi:putative hemolysin